MRRLHLLQFAVCFCLAGLSNQVFAQSLTDKLSEDQTFYKNYGKETYTKVGITAGTVGLYDQFGEHITDGKNIYQFSNNTYSISNNNNGYNDSLVYSNSDEMQKQEFFENFSNVVITQDAIGGLKTSFLIGDQITTRFTPLTFNKVNYHGIRWDFWTSGVQMSLLATRTRPGFLSKQDRDGSSLVQYPSIGISGDSLDMSNQSPYGDYDMLLALHGENTIANKVNVGLTYINHHMTSAQTGEKWLSGDVPSAWLPNEVHFEFFDATAGDTNDAGVYVLSVEMYINGKKVEANTLKEDNEKFTRTYIGDNSGLLLLKTLPLAKPQNGTIPVIVTFKIDPEYFQFVDERIAGRPGRTIADRKDIKSIKFRYTIAGNYLVFVSTDRQIPMAMTSGSDFDGGFYNGRVPKTNTVASIFDNRIPRDSASIYYGNYIAKPASFISMRASDFKYGTATNIAFAQKEPSKYNYRTLEYEYNINVSSVTYGVNFKGDLAGVKFSGEVALNQAENMLPGSNDSRQTINKWIANLKAQREVSKTMGLNGEFYYISPQWKTNRDYLFTSQYYNNQLYGRFSQAQQPYSRPLGENQSFIDDNDDNDQFPESDRRRYPSDQASDQQAKFNADGSMNSSNAKSLMFPNGLGMINDDPDGVVASKDDRNKNSIADYKEDFLLFSSDPPVFELGTDLNNNGVPDYEDDDVLPDYGHSVGYEITGDGITTQGIQGLSLNLRWTPVDNTTIDFGGIAEGIADRDLNTQNSTLDEGSKNAVLPWEKDFNWEGKSFVAYITAKQEVTKRSQGLQYDMGIELRGIRDALRNDVVRSVYQGSNQYAYSYQTDPLNYRKAVVGNVVGSVVYNNIRNFEYTFKAKVGAENRFEIPENFYSVNTIGTDQFVERWAPYYGRVVGAFDIVNKMSYRIGFKNDYEDWRRAFNFINNLDITPQYKITFSMRDELMGPDQTKKNPWNYEQNERWIRQLDEANRNGQYTTADSLNQLMNQASLTWIEYYANHQKGLMNVPIIKANYKIAENTALQLGFQWQKTLDLDMPQNDASNFSAITQIVSKANYKGYSVTFYIGGAWNSYNHDVNQPDDVTRTGYPYNAKDYRIFAQIYAGQ